MISRQAIVAAVPIDKYLEASGRTVERKGKESFCLCPFHADKHASLRINHEKALWFCDPCGIGGSIIDLVIRLKGCSVKDAIFGLAEQAGIADESDKKPHKVATYEYRDQYNRRVMEVDRIEEWDKKKFAQFRAIEEDKRAPGIEGVQRVLYRLERWAGKEEIALVEGEKCVHLMESIGIDATSCPGGSNGWLAAYSEYLKDKHVDVWPDSDTSGKKWLEAVTQSLEGKVASMRVIFVPQPYNDVGDVIEAQGEELARKTIFKLMGDTVRVERGVNLPVLSSREAYDLYVRRITTITDVAVDLGKWLPSLRQYSRVLLPGDMFLILSDTGVGKTTILTNIAKSQRPLPVLMFELELSPEPMTERFIANDQDVDTLSVERRTKDGTRYDVSGWDHVYLCHETKIDLERMEEIIRRSELKIQRKPALILVDYIGLMGGASGSEKRYEKISNAAEGLKRLARATDTIIGVASQVRRDENRTEISLHDGRDSGAVEASAQLVIGAWRPAPGEMNLRILKQTKMAGQNDIRCIFHGDRQRIVEMAEPKHGGGCYETER